MYQKSSLLFLLSSIFILHGCNGEKSNSRTILDSSDINLSNNRENQEDNITQNDSSNTINLPNQDIKEDDSNIDNEEINSSHISNFSDIQGKVVDGELIYATVFLDLNLNSILNIDEPRAITNEYGEYKLELNSTVKENSNYINHTAPLISIGGFDKKSKREFRGIFSAPFDGKYLNITPITTILLKMLQNREDDGNNFQTRLNIVKKDLAKSLSIDENDLTKDPIDLANSGDFTLLKISLQIHQSSELLLKSIKEGESIDFYTILAKELNKKESISSIEMLIQNTIDNSSNSFKSLDIAKASIRQLNQNIETIFIENRDNFKIDQTLITKISIIINKVKEDIEEALNQADSNLEDDAIWGNKYKEHEIKDINFEVVIQLLSTIGYQNETIAKEISKLDKIDSSLTLKTLRATLISFSKYSNIIELIDKKLTELKDKEGLNETTYNNSFLLNNAQKAIDNMGRTTSYSFILDEKQFRAVVYANKIPLSLNSSSTTAIYGTINSIKTKSSLKLNSSYPADTLFQVRVFNKNNILIKITPILQKIDASIDFGKIILY